MGILAGQAYSRLKEEILSCRIAPGSPVSEAALSKELGISRTPTREALQRLSQEGLVEYFVGRGYFVSAIEPRDVREILDMRRMLEGYAAASAARNFEVGEYEAVLEQLVDQMRTFANTAPHLFDVNRYYQQTRAMDELIVQLVDNDRLVESLERIWSESIRLRHIAAADPIRLASSALEHVEILGAIGDADAQRAETVTRDHVSASLDNILVSLSRERSISSRPRVSVRDTNEG